MIRKVLGPMTIQHVTFDVAAQSASRSKFASPLSIYVDVSSKQAIICCLLPYRLHAQKDKWRLLETFKGCLLVEYITTLLSGINAYI